MSETSFTEQDREKLKRATGCNFGVQAANRAIAEIDSLRERLRGAQKAANLGGPPTGRTCSVDGHAIFGGFHGEAGIDGPVMCDVCWLNHVEAERDSLRAQLGEAQKQNAQLKADLEYQTEARVLDAKDNTANFRAWKAEHHTPIVADRDTLRSEVERLDSENRVLRDQLGKADGLAEMQDLAIRALQLKLERTREALRLIQWGGAHSMGLYCPRCKLFKGGNHAPDCEVGAALAGSAKEPSVASQPSADFMNGWSVAVDKIEFGAILNGFPDFKVDQSDCIETTIGRLIEAARAKAQSETGGAA